MIQNLIFRVYLLISDYLESLKANNSKQKRSLILQFSFAQKIHSFYEAKLIQHYEKFTPATQPKTFLTLQMFQQPSFLVVIKKRSRKLLSREWLNNSLKAACCSGLVFYFI